MIYVLSGGDANLNFRVIGGTSAPASPKENDIWVNTDTAISEWVFSAEQPAQLSEGMVWFQTGTSSQAAFNALKKNNITVYPKSCKQYVGGAWVAKPRKTYQDGEWKEWKTYLYSKGNEFADLTGGWVSRDDSSYFNTGTLTKAADYMEASITTGRQNIFSVTKNAFDLTAFDVVTFDVTNVVLEGKLYVLANGATIGADAGVASIQIKAAGEYSIDVSNLSGMYQIGFGTWSENTVRSVRVSEVYLA